MATISTTRTATDAEGDQRVVLAGVGWEGYRTLLKLRGERRSPRMVYLDGNVTLMSPSYLHEFLRIRLGRFVTELLFGLRIDHLPSGSTTFRRRPRKGGVEADHSYYLTNLDRIRGKQKLHLRDDPPPDLAIEVVVRHDAEHSVEVYRRFGVREVWICDEDRLTILRLGEDGHYTESNQSVVSPSLSADEIHSWVTRDQDELAWMEDLRRWVGEVLAPRHRETK
jgi:Uma2 family endonuclease